MCAFGGSEPGCRLEAGKSNPLRVCQTRRSGPTASAWARKAGANRPASYLVLFSYCCRLQTRHHPHDARLRRTHAPGSDELEPPCPQGLVIATSPDIWGPTPFLFSLTSPLRTCLQHNRATDEKRPRPNGQREHGHRQRTEHLTSWEKGAHDSSASLSHELYDAIASLAPYSTPSLATNALAIRRQAPTDEPLTTLLHRDQTPEVHCDGTAKPGGGLHKHTLVNSRNGAPV